MMQEECSRLGCLYGKMYCNMQLELHNHFNRLFLACCHINSDSRLHNKDTTKLIVFKAAIAIISPLQSDGLTAPVAI